MGWWTDGIYLGSGRTNCGMWYAPTRALCRIKLLPVACFGGHMDVNC